MYLKNTRHFSTQYVASARKCGNSLRVSICFHQRLNYLRNYERVNDNINILYTWWRIKPCSIIPTVNTGPPNPPARHLGKCLVFRD